MSKAHTFQLLANVGYVRNTGPEHLAWKRVGKLFYSDKDNCARILLYGFRQGMCAGKPSNIEHPPFLQGDIVYPCGIRDGQAEYLFVGWITTSETEKQEVLYTVHLECAPFVTATQVWLNINLEDSDEYTPDVQPCYF